MLKIWLGWQTKLNLVVLKTKVCFLLSIAPQVSCEDHRFFCTVMWCILRWKFALQYLTLCVLMNILFRFMLLNFLYFLIIISNLIICILKCMNFVLLLFSIYGCIIFYVGLGYWHSIIWFLLVWLNSTFEIFGSEFYSDEWISWRCIELVKPKYVCRFW